ncbi:MAG: diaminopimelate dehydrogenase [Defluviitaleaceae bacterium]|nr:diaminopimelate dehydrogenase [Defluviitaleaceae bacterium]
MIMVKTVIVGYGNIGKAVYDALSAAPDMSVAGVVLRDREKAREKGVPEGVPVFEDVSEPGTADVAILCVPSRSVPNEAVKYLAKGIHTVDSYDLHGEAMLILYNTLDTIGKKHNSVAVIGMGLDPGVDTLIRGIFETAAPKGISYTNFGPGMSMGHTTVVKSIEGVKNGLSVTLPLGAGLHRRMVYVEIMDGYDFDTISDTIKKDPYFVKDETHVIQTNDVSALQDVGHGMNIERKGVSGKTDNQLFNFDMRVNNPAVTAQIMVAAARAAMRQKPGCHTPLDIPVADMLYGGRDDLIRRLV